jgi:primosomal protein N' (replication factor Y)
VRLRVPFGRGNRIGVLVEVAQGTSLPLNKLKRVATVLDRAPVIDADLLKFLSWAADYYHHPLGEVVLGALPRALRRGRPVPEQGTPGWALSPAGGELDAEQLRRAPRQKALLEILRRHPAGLSETELSESLVSWRAPMRALVSRHLVQRISIPLPQTSDPALSQPPSLNPEQQQAAESIFSASREFAAFLLNGVTGSGKTEVYLELINRLALAGRQALVLIPEIGLTPQIVSRFRARLKAEVVVLHSGLSEKERFAAWLAARDGRASVVIGTRSAVFTPLKNPGIFIVDEEQDPSFKQQDALRYSARDLAVVRAQMFATPVVLGSATPSLETVHNVASGRYTQLDLPLRAGEATPPSLEVVDIRGRSLQSGLSEPLLAALESCVESHEQAILFINRRGFAPSYICRCCGWVAECDRCDANMVLHRPEEQLLCHHCASRRSLPAECPRCGKSEFRHQGVGTQRVAETLSARLPGTRIYRVDRDSTRRKGAFEALIESMHGAETDIVVGTQMVAKGHHFPNVTLVGVVDADSGLFGVDFRSGERMAQLLLQVAGRAGRGEKPGRVMIQTHHPNHPLLRALMESGYGAFADNALAERAEAGLPPFAHMALLRAEAQRSEACDRFLSQALECGESLGVEAVNLLGPVPAPMARRAGRYRSQLFVESGRRGPLHRFLKSWLSELERFPSARRVRWSLDVDPQEII